MQAGEGLQLVSYPAESRWLEHQAHYDVGQLLIRAVPIIGQDFHPVHWSLYRRLFPHSTVGLVRNQLFEARKDMQFK